ncbi:MAG: aldehyde dehydrogenase family protein, partial [Acidobacteriota bacterium]
MPTSERLSNYINGQWRASNAQRFADVMNPATGEKLAEVPLDGEADVKAAIESAAAAFPEWRRTPPEERIQFLFRLKQLLEEHI